MAKATIDDVLRRFDSIDRWRAAVSAKQDKHDKTLYGNGAPGHDEMLREVFAFIKEQREAALRRQAWWDKLQWVIIPSAFAIVGTFIWQAIVFYVKIYPTLP